MIILIDVNEEELRAHFSSISGITNVHVVRASGIGIGKGIAYISFKVTPFSGNELLIYENEG